LVISVTSDNNMTFDIEEINSIIQSGLKGMYKLDDHALANFINDKTMKFSIKKFAKERHYGKKFNIQVLDLLFDRPAILRDSNTIDESEKLILISYGFCHK